VDSGHRDFHNKNQLIAGQFLPPTLTQLAAATKTGTHLLNSARNIKNGRQNGVDLKA
jgi:hypothetical protein